MSGSHTARDIEMRTLARGTIAMNETRILFRGGMLTKKVKRTDENQGIVEFKKMEYPLNHDQMRSN